MEVSKLNPAPTKIHISRVTSASDDGNKTKHTFQYELNDTRTKRKIYEGALRAPYERENKKTCINLIFSDGAFKEVVMKAIIDLKEGPTHFKVNDEEVEKVEIDPRTELTGKHVDTKINFKVNGSKIVIHVYNSKQKLTIQGSKFEWFVDHYLEPFLKQRISISMDRINKIKQTILSKLGPNSKKSKKVESTLDEATDIICDECDLICKTTTELQKHVTNVHSNLFQGLSIQTTRQLETQMDETESCDKCKFTTHDSDDLRVHIVSKHTSESYHKCDACSYSTLTEEDMNKHKHLHTAEVISGFLH